MKNLLLIPLLFLFCFSQGQIKLDQLNEDEGLYSVVIIKNDKTIFGEYYHDMTEEDLFHIQSQTKSIVAILIGIAIEEGHIKSVDQKISDFFPELLKDTSKSKITIKHLLDQTSGLQEYEWPKILEWLNNENPTKFILSQPLASTPGTKFQYNTAATHILSAILSKATKTSTASYANDHLFKPLGITDYQWARLNDGYDDGGGVAVSMKTEDMAKIGNMLLHKGNWNGRQLVPEKWIKQLFSLEKDKAPWGLPGSVYGLCWYNGTFKGQAVHYTMGYGGQYIFIFPDLQMVIAVNHDNKVQDANGQSRIFMNKYLPIIVDAIMAYHE
jgi:CubicO group peptidase (beta-lactamase class C family)